MKIQILLGIACLPLAACARPRAPNVGTREARPSVAPQDWHLAMGEGMTSAEASRLAKHSRGPRS
jgi:hypothetical protein